MNFADFMGLTALIVTIIYTGFGLPVQIYKNFKSKTTYGLSLSMMVLLFLTFLSWVVYAWVKTPRDFYIIISNAIGMISVSIIIYQFWAYRSQTKAE
ncbi:MAG: hypothetical protein E4H13_02695 [Calditrichales bacterium]|nr:MAG: hypothetical protein E4H13_02695 [Calditrichales bacterium]